MHGKESEVEPIDARVYLGELFREMGVILDDVVPGTMVCILTMGGDGDFHGLTTSLPRSVIAKARQSKPSAKYERHIRRLERFLQDSFSMCGATAGLLSKQEQLDLCEQAKRIVPECICTTDIDVMVASVKRSILLGDRGHGTHYWPCGVWWIRGDRL